MKIKWFKACVFFIFLLGVSVGRLKAGNLTNSVAAQESWESISNRWSVVALDKIAAAAEKSDLSAQYYLGVIYSYGISVTNDDAVAFKWIQMAAAQGRPQAQRMLGWFYQTGKGVAFDPQAAIKWYQKSVGQGDYQAKINLAWVYAEGIYGPHNIYGQGTNAQIRSGGVVPDHEAAEKLMREAADLNSAEGQSQMGDLIYNEVNNEGVQDKTRFSDAAVWYKKSAEQNYAPAQFALAEMYHAGKLGDDQRANCISWYLKAAAQGHIEARAAIVELPKYYPNDKLLQSINMLDALQAAATNDNLQAEFELARRYKEGIGVPVDPKKAFEWMAKAAEHDVSPITLTIDAHYYLGVMYEKGYGVAKDMDKARALYMSAAVGGNKPEPFTRVGLIYENGEGVSQDYQKAAIYYYTGLQFGFFATTHGDVARCTALEHLLNLYAGGQGLPGDQTEVAQQLDSIRQNHPITTAKAQYLFGKIYYEGRYVSKDLAEAAAWFHLAASENFADARQTLTQIESRLSASESTNEKHRIEALENRIKDAKHLNTQFESCDDCIWW